MKGSSHILSLTSRMLHLVIICSTQVVRAHSMSIDRNMKTKSLYGALRSLCKRFGPVILIIFSLLIVHDHDRMSSITRDLRATTWNFFTASLPHRFGRSPSVVREAIMTDINDLVQELMASSDGVGASFFAMHRLFKILGMYFHYLVLLIPFFATVDLADKYLDILGR